MIFTTSKAEFLTAANIVSGAASKSNPVAMLANAKITICSSDSLLTIEATNMDIKISASIACEAASDAKMCVDANDLAGILRRLQDGQLTCEYSDDDTLQKLLIKSGRSRLSLQCVQTSDYPDVLKIGSGAVVTVLTSDLARLVEKTRFAMYPNDTRANLQGIYLHKSQNSAGQDCLCFAATDAHRLAIAYASFSCTDAVPSVIIPKKTILELKKVIEKSLDAGDDNVQIELTEKYAKFTFNKFVLATKLVDGVFPDYKNVVPSKDGSQIIEVVTKDLSRSIERVSAIYTNSTETALYLKFTAGNMEVSTKKSDANNAVDELEAVFTGEESLAVTYNYNYLLEILSHISAEKTVFSIQNAQAAALIKDGIDDSYFYVLMPMRK